MTNREDAKVAKLNKRSFFFANYAQFGIKGRIAAGKKPFDEERSHVSSRLVIFSVLRLLMAGVMLEKQDLGL